MSVKGEIKEGAGFVKKEMNEHGKSPGSPAQNAGRSRPSERRLRQRPLSPERAIPKSRDCQICPPQKGGGDFS
jgi:hypothetical protein